MKKALLATLALGGLLGLSSCGNITWSQVQNQIASMFSLESTTAVIVSGILDKHPETVDLFKKMSADIVKLSEKDVLTLDDVKADIQKRIADAKIFCKTELLLAVDKIFDKISSDPQFNVAAHKDQLLDIASGIDWAVVYYDSKNPNQEVTVSK